MDAPEAKWPACRLSSNEREIHARTGCVLHWTYWPAKLRWLRRTSPDVYRSRGALDLVRRVLPGAADRRDGDQPLDGIRHRACSTSTAARGTPRCWSSWGSNPRQLGTLASVRDADATTTRWPALKGVLWLPAVGDGACSNVGAGCASPEHFALMIGTSGAERAVWSPSADFLIPWGLWCYRVDETRIAMGGALNDGGSLLDWLRATLQLPELDQARGRGCCDRAGQPRSDRAAVLGRRAQPQLGRRCARRHCRPAAQHTAGGDPARVPRGRGAAHSPPLTACFCKRCLTLARVIATGRRAAALERLDANHGRRAGPSRPCVRGSRGVQSRRSHARPGSTRRGADMQTRGP